MVGYFHVRWWLTVVAAIVTQLKHSTLEGQSQFQTKSKIKELRNAIHYSHYKHNEPGDENQSGNLKKKKKKHKSQSLRLNPRESTGHRKTRK
jgi:hypothetical protein